MSKHGPRGIDIIKYALASPANAFMAWLEWTHPFLIAHPFARYVMAGGSAFVSVLAALMIILTIAALVME